MKLFLSYGHDANAAFVLRIKRDLERHGHACWIDSEQIHNQPDWRRSLTDALHDAEWTLGFLSRHAMRPGGVTAQEIAIAQDQRGGCLTTVLMEPLDGWQVPVSVGHAQWVDMSAWAAKQAEGDAAFEPWYAEKRAELLARLRPDLAQRYADEVRALEDWLQPVPQKADIDKLCDGFVGREWLVDILETWRLHNPDARRFWLTGAPGTGKSAFAAWLTATHLANVVALNLCRWDLRDRCDATRVVRTLACFVARRVQDYRSQLLRLMPQLDPETLDCLDAPTLFDRLLAQPLAHCFDGGRNGDRLLLVVDGLDEAVAQHCEAALHNVIDVLRKQGPLLPAWVGLLVTSRPEQPAATAFAGLPMKRIDADVEHNRADLRLYARAWLTTTDRTPAEVDALVAAMDARADGSFIYLRKLREAHEAKRLPLDADSLPEGLGGLYDEWFRRQFPDAKDYRARIAPLLALILAADTPVPDAILDEGMAWDPVTAATILQSLGSLFERRRGGWAPFHKSLRDWLTEREHTLARHLVVVSPARTQLAEILWKHFVAASHDPNVVLDSFLLHELPALVVTLGAPVRDNWIRVVSDLDALVLRCAETVKRLRHERAWADVLAWCGMSDQLALVMGKVGWNLRRWCMLELGNVLLLLGRSGEALAAYRTHNDIAARAVAESPDNPVWQQELAVSQGLIGDVLVVQGHLNQALDAYRATMDIVVGIADADPKSSQAQNNISACHQKIGDVFMALRDPESALRAYRDSHAITARLADIDAAAIEWQRGLSISHNKIGDVLLTLQDLPGALAEYNARMKIATALGESDPENIVWTRDLAITHCYIGNVLMRQDKFAAALNEYRANQEIAASLANADPANAGWQRNFSISHSKVGDALAAQDLPAAALTSYRASFAIAERLAQSDLANGQWQRDLFVVLIRLTTLLLQLGHRDSACQMAQRLDMQAYLLAGRFPQHRERNDYLREDRELLTLACGP